MTNPNRINLTFINFYESLCYYFYFFLSIYSSVVLRDKSDTPNEQNIIYMNIDRNRYPKESSTDDLANYDVYGSTPPRTRIKNKTKDWDNRKQKL